MLFFICLFVVVGFFWGGGEEDLAEAKKMFLTDRPTDTKFICF